MNINKKITWLLFIGIIVLSVILRLWQLGNIPPSPDWDEVALGYDAYSLLHTGRDEYGKLFPVVLRSFNDYKPAMYAYLAIPSVAVFGLNTFAVRLPSAVFGVIATIVLFFLIRELFEKYKYKDQLALISSLLFAISPWSLQFSRIGFESNVGDAFNILMALFFVKGLKKPLLLGLSATMGAFSIYTYQSDKVFTPLLALLLIFVFRKALFALKKKYLILAVVVGFVVISPMIFYILTDKSALLRVKGTSIFNYQTEILKNNVQKLERDKANNDYLGLVLDNRRVVYAKTIVYGYISHFDLNWLFTSGDILRHHAPNVGIIYLFELPFILIGIYKLLFSDLDKKAKLTILGWFLLAPVPASITTGVPHAVRTLNFLPTWQILSAVGLVSSLYFILQYKRIKYFAISIFLCLAIFNFTYYLNQYFVQLNYYTSQDWQYGYKEAVAEVVAKYDKYDKIIISDREPMDKSYMFFLFYLKYPPAEYQKIGVNSSGQFDYHHQFDKFVFRNIDWEQDYKLRDTMIVATSREIAPKFATKVIKNLDGSPAIVIVEK